MHTGKRNIFYTALFTAIAGTIILLLVSKSKELRLLQYIKQKIGTGNNQNIGVPDPLLGWLHRPNVTERSQTSEFNVSYTTNSSGLRDREVPLEKKTGIYRILALGESTLFGEGIAYGKRFSEVIEDALEGVEVINLGVRGFGFDQSLLFLERDGFTYQPDQVIIFFSEQDYLERCKDFIRTEAFKPRFVLSAGKDSLIFNGIEQNRRQFGNTEIVKMSRSLVENLGPKGGEKGDKDFWEAISKSLELTRQLRGEYSNDDFKRLLYLLLKRFRDDCSQYSVPCSAVVIDKGIADYMVEFCAQLGIPCLDIREVLVKASRSHRLRFAIDPHYNEFAHAVIGEYTGNFLKDCCLLKPNKAFRYRYLGKWQ